MFFGRRFIKITDASLVPCIAAYAASEAFRGRSFTDTLEKIMRFWLSFCLKQVPKGDKAKVEAYLMKQVASLPAKSAVAALPASATKTAKRRAATVDRFRNTLVARLLRKFDIYGAKAIRNPERFYQLCSRYLSRRKSSVHTHRASLIDPLRKLKGTASNAAKLKNSPHALIEKATSTLASIAVDAWGSARATPQNKRRPKGMAGIAGKVFHKTLSMVEAMAARWLAERLVSPARRAGFTARMLA